MKKHKLSIGNLTAFAKKILSYIEVICFMSFALGIYLALFSSPDDYKQGEIVRIMYIHVPSAWLSLSIYSFIAVLSFISLVWSNSVASVLAQSAAPIGTTFTTICLITGSIWGKSTWGTWWVWDARLTSMLILFFLYIGYMLLWNLFENRVRAEKSTAVFAIFSVVNIPIVKFSVDLWSTLHQPASIIRSSGIAIEFSLLLPLIVMFIFYITLFLTIWILRSLHLINIFKIRREISIRY